MLKLIVVLVSIHSSLLSAQSQTLPQEKQPAEVADNKISTTRYVVGGILGTTLGFGIGHGVQHRWSDYGWMFTTAAIITGSGTIRGGCGAGPGPRIEHKIPEPMNLWLNPDYENCVARKKRRAKPWKYAFLGVKALETIHIWWPHNVAFTHINQPPASVSVMDISSQDYVLGGVLGMFVGFGSGHALQGRWSDKGQYYTFTQLAAATLVVAGLLLGYDPAGYVGSSIFLISRIAEMVSVWRIKASHYRVVSAKPKKWFSLMPLLNTEQAGIQLVMAI